MSAGFHDVAMNKIRYWISRFREFKFAPMNVITISINTNLAVQVGQVSGQGGFGKPNQTKKHSVK